MEEEAFLLSTMSSKKIMMTVIKQWKETVCKSALSKMVNGLNCAQRETFPLLTGKDQGELSVVKEYTTSSEPVSPSSEVHSDHEGRNTKDTEYSPMLQRDLRTTARNAPKSDSLSPGEGLVLQKGGFPRTQDVLHRSVVLACEQPPNAAFSICKVHWDHHQDWGH